MHLGQLFQQACQANVQSAPELLNYLQGPFTNPTSPLETAQEVREMQQGEDDNDDGDDDVNLLQGPRQGYQKLNNGVSCGDLEICRKGWSQRGQCIDHCNFHQLLMYVFVTIISEALSS